MVCRALSADGGKAIQLRAPRPFSGRAIWITGTDGVGWGWPAIEKFQSGAPDFGASKSGGTGFRHCLILLADASAHAYGPDNVAAAFQWNASGEDHHPAVIGSVNAEELIAGL